MSWHARKSVKSFLSCRWCHRTFIYMYKDLGMLMYFILSDDDFEIKSKYYSFIIVLSCFDSYLGFSECHYSSGYATVYSSKLPLVSTKKITKTIFNIFTISALHGLTWPQIPNFTSSINWYRSISIYSPRTSSFFAAACFAITTPRQQTAAANVWEVTVDSANWWCSFSHQAVMLFCWSALFSLPAYEAAKE